MHSCDKQVLVTDAFGLPDDALVSIRYGNTRQP